MNFSNILSLISAVSFIVSAGVSNASCSENVQLLPIEIPNVRPESPEIYLCSSKPVAANETNYIVRFEPKANMETAHHLMVFGCLLPGRTESVWNCGEMYEVGSIQSGMPVGTPCSGEYQILYAWGRNATTFNLPEGVGFAIGKNTLIQHLVMQVHYADVSRFADGSTDNSGVTLYISHERLPKAAGVIVLGTFGVIPPMSNENMEASCVIHENFTFHPFAFRVHAHQLGRVISGYRVRMNNETMKQKWELIGKQNPMSPQMFNPLESNMTIQYGDILTSRCTMVSDRETVTKIGPRNDDEMCNFYIMYWTEDIKSPTTKLCFTDGPPKYYWKTGMNPRLTEIPDAEASTI